MQFQYQIDVQGYGSDWSEDRIDQLAMVWSFTLGQIHIEFKGAYKAFDLVYDDVGDVYVAPLEAIEWLNAQEVHYLAA